MGGRILACILFCPWVLAQTPQWLADGGRLISDASGYRWVDPKGRLGPTLHLPKGGGAPGSDRETGQGLGAGLARFMESRVVAVHAFEGAIAYTRVYRTGPSDRASSSTLLGTDLNGRGRLELMLKQNAEIRVVGSLDVEDLALVPDLYPLGNGKVLSVGPVRWEVPKGKVQPSPYALWSVSEAGRLSFLSFVGAGHPSNALGAWFQKALPVLRTHLTEDHLIAHCPQLGWFWVLSRQDGRLLRFVELYSDLPASVTQINGDWSLLSGVATAVDGSLVIAARPREEFLKGLEETEAGHRAARSLEPVRGPGIPVTQAFRTQFDRAEAFRKRQRLEIFQKYPFLQWFAWDPGKGHPKPLNPAPPGARSICNTPEAFRARWSLTRAGTVSYVGAGSPDATAQNAPR